MNLANAMIGGCNCTTHWRLRSGMGPKEGYWRWRKDWIEDLHLQCWMCHLYVEIEFFGLSLLGLLAKIMCSICSCQLDIWHAGHCPASISNWSLDPGLDKDACISRSTDCPSLTLPLGTVQFTIIECVYVKLQCLQMVMKVQTSFNLTYKSKNHRFRSIACLGFWPDSCNKKLYKAQHQKPQDANHSLQLEWA